LSGPWVSITIPVHNCQQRKDLNRRSSGGIFVMSPIFVRDSIFWKIGRDEKKRQPSNKPALFAIHG
jgi:hypothetical protein